MIAAVCFQDCRGYLTQLRVGFRLYLDKRSDAEGAQQRMLLEAGQDLVKGLLRIEVAGVPAAGGKALCGELRAADAVELNDGAGQLG